MGIGVHLEGLTAEGRKREMQRFSDFVPYMHIWLLPPEERAAEQARVKARLEKKNKAAVK
jgi:hypothetical protein